MPKNNSLIRQEVILRNTTNCGIILLFIHMDKAEGHYPLFV